MEITKALVLATGISSGMKPLNEYLPTPMVPFFDRPLIQHIIELLVAKGIAEFDVIVNHFPEKIEEFIGDGSRWGCRCNTYLTANPHQPYSQIKHKYKEDDRPFLLIDADLLIHTSLQDIKTKKNVSLPTFFYWRETGKNTETIQEHWSGWAYISGKMLYDLPDNVSLDSFESYFCHAYKDSMKREYIPKPICFSSIEKFATAHWCVLQEKECGVALSVKGTDGGIYISRNVVLHPSAKIIPPVYIGENCHIHTATQIGPNFILGHNSILDKGCKGKNSIVFPGTYVGEGLELEDVIVDKNRLINIHNNTVLSVTDDFILGNMSERNIQDFIQGIISQLLGILLLILCSPLLLLIVLYRKFRGFQPVFYKKDVVRIPASTDELVWQTFPLWSFSPHSYHQRHISGKKANDSYSHFFLHFIPGLINMAFGKLRLVGVQPRTVEEIKKLPEDWRSLYLSSKIGIITEAFVQFGGTASNDELYSAEAFYATTATLKRDIRLFFGYLSRIITSR